MRDTNSKIISKWSESEKLKELLNQKRESFRKQEENNLAIREMLKILEQANLNSKNEILELESIQNKLVNNLEINNSIQSSLDNLNNLFGGTNIPLKHLIRPGKDHCAIEAKFSSSSQINNWLISKGFKSSFSELNIKRTSYKKNNKIL